MTQRRLKPTTEGYQVCAGEERKNKHPHFGGRDLALPQILRGARNEPSLLNDVQWFPESLAFNHPANAPYIQELTTIYQQLAQCLQRPIRLLEVEIRTDRVAESLLTQLNTGQIEYVGLKQSQDMLLSARQRFTPWPGVRLSLWNANMLTAHAYSADIIWFNNILHRLPPGDPGLLATLQQLVVLGVLLYMMEFRQLTPSTLLSTLLLTSGQPEALLHNGAD